MRKRDVDVHRSSAELLLHRCFFFSSRRRHTRYWRDWSSDVCSSDLERVTAPKQYLGVEFETPQCRDYAGPLLSPSALGHDEGNVIVLLLRAEPPDFFDNRIQQCLGRQCTISPQRVDQTPFPELLSLPVE